MYSCSFDPHYSSLLCSMSVLTNFCVPVCFVRFFIKYPRVLRYGLERVVANKHTAQGKSALHSPWHHQVASCTNILMGLFFRLPSSHFGVLLLLLTQRASSAARGVKPVYNRKPSSPSLNVYAEPSMNITFICLFSIGTNFVPTPNLACFCFFLSCSCFSRGLKHVCSLALVRMELLSATVSMR